MGVYGLIQFFYLPPWDHYWMEAHPKLPENLPAGGRVFSTLNSPTLGAVMMAGLLAFCERRLLSLAAAQQLR